MTELKIGVALPYATPRKVAEAAQVAEEADWDGCFVGDAIWCEDPMIGLAAAAMVTQRIHLGMMIVPVPLRRPWKLASESVALDRLSDGRLILGLGTGAVWMGWQSFPDEVTDPRARAEMLDETIDILTLLYQRKQFDYEGRHYHLKLTLMDERHYPPRPVQQPRIPLWVVGHWPRRKSIQRALKGDGLIAEKLNNEGKGEDITPEDVCAIQAYIHESRTLDRPFDIVLNGNSAKMEAAQRGKTLSAFREAGATWWIEGLWEETEDHTLDRIRQGPPRLD